MDKLFVPYGRVGGKGRLFAALALAAILLGLWTIFPNRLMPSPLETWLAVGRLVETRGLIHELGVSMQLNLTATVIATGISMLLAYGQIVPAIRPITAFVENWRFLSTVGLTFGAMILIHDAHWVKVFVIVCLMVPFILSSLAASVRSIDEDEFNHARTLKLGHIGTTWEVIIRGKIDHVLEAVRQNFAIGWGLTPVVESLVRSEGGVGLLLVEEAKFLRLDGLLAIIIIIFAVGKLQDVLLRWVRVSACPYVTIGTGALK